MKCPKCGYHSFDHLDSCKKCGKGLVEHKERFNFRRFFSSGHKGATKPEAVGNENHGAAPPSAGGAIDFGFDFLEEEEEPISETTGSKSAPEDKPEKGPEFNV